MAAYMTLPTEPSELAKAVSHLIAEALPTRNARSVEWMLSYYYLEGIRNFPEINYLDGKIRISYTSKGGTRGFRYEEVLSRFQGELGRLLRLDVRPAVKRSALSLDNVRKTAVAQAVLDVLFPGQLLDNVKLSMFPMLLLYGTVGLATWPTRKPDGKIWPVIEVIPPWELVPIPANPATESDLCGIIRTRWVPRDWLAQLEAIKLPEPQSPEASRMETITIAYGAPTPASGGPRQDGGDVGAPFSSRPNNENARRTEPPVSERVYVKLNEVWLEGDWNRVARYCVTSGDVVLLDKLYERSEMPPMPIATARNTHIGGFYARSFVEPLIALNAEMEAMYSNLFKNIRDLDLFGILMVPASSGILVNAFKAGKRPKVLPYEPDHLVPDAKPYTLTPANAGLLPVRIIETATQAMDRISMQSELFRGDAPGRVDSARALGLLFETAAVPLAAPILSIASAFSKIYAAALYNVRFDWKELQVASVTLLEEALVGVSLDPETGTMSLVDNAIPDPSEIEISIQSKFPQSLEQRRMDLIDMLQRGLITPRDFRILARKNGLDLPVANDAEWNNYLQAVLNNIILFGDGETPGKIIEAEYEIHEIHLERLIAFMSRPEFKLASQQVRAAFADAKARREEFLGKLPDQAPFPEDLNAGSGVGGTSPLLQTLGLAPTPPVGIEAEEETAEIRHSPAGARSIATPQGGAVPPPLGV